MNDVIEHGYSNTYSRLVWWELHNFMSFEYAKCEFDVEGDVNVINIKGYNDSGKSNLIRALDVLFYNRYSMQHSEFIQDNKSFFDIRAMFSDGVMVRRVKYSTGQGVYEMYKDNQLVYTSKQNGVFTKINKVPDIIEEYLGLLKYGDFFLNSRACFEKQLLVQTTGSENYKFLNSLLYSEELALASSLLNTDINEVMAEKNKLEISVQILNNQLNSFPDIGLDLIEKMEESDKSLDELTARESLLTEVVSIDNQINSIEIAPILDTVDSARVDSILELYRLNEASNVVIPPEVEVVDTERLNLLLSICNAKVGLDSMVATPEVKKIDKSSIDRLSDLVVIVASLQQLEEVQLLPIVDTVDSERVSEVLNLWGIYSSLVQAESEWYDYESKVKEKKTTIELLKRKAEDSGIKTVICSNCGSLELVEM